MNKPIIDVAIALVLRNGHWLVARRPPHSHAGGLWEFPGGKQRPTEHPTHAACRELLEECAVRATALDSLAPVTWEYEDRVVRLTPVLCRWEGEDPHTAPAGERQWVTTDELLSLPMPPPNTRIVQLVLRHLGLSVAR